MNIFRRVAKLEEVHKACDFCGIIGHSSEMISSKGDWFIENFTIKYQTRYYHKDCYAKKFHMHLCPNGCGKWLPNKKGEK